MEVNAEYLDLINEAGKVTLQRVPPTESKGRRHTSILNILISPLNLFNFKLEEKDIEIQYTKGSGAGGQNRNKRSTACRLTHIPTGIQVLNCEERKQGQNREKALQILTEKVREIYYNQYEQKLLGLRKQQMTDSLGGRSEKHRTYNFINNFVLDHRTNKKANCKDIMKGHFELLK